MEKIMIVAGLLLLLTGCNSNINTTERNPSGNNYPTECINGVTYYMFTEGGHGAYAGYGFLAPKWNPDKTLETCG